MSMYCPTDLHFFRVLLTRNDARELLLQAGPKGFHLPILGVSRFARPAKELTEAIEEHWGISAFCLFQLLEKAASETRYSIAIFELCRESEMKADNLAWREVASLASSNFSEPADLVDVERALKTLRQQRSGKYIGPFGRPGSFPMIHEWVASKALPLGLHLAGKFQQWNSGTSFSLIRFETDGPALWFKAVGDPNRREHAVTRTLAELFPAYLPPFVASQDEWNAWLSLEAPGNHLTTASPLRHWTLVVDSLAGLQIASLGYSLDILTQGARDARVRTLYDAIDGFLEDAAILMEGQTAPALAFLCREEPFCLGEELKFSLETIDALELPNVLGHLDFNCTNVLVSADRCVFLDWAEACVGPPILTLAGVLESFGNLSAQTTEAQDQLIAKFYKHWSALRLRYTNRLPLEIISLVGLFARLVGSSGWKDTDRTSNPALTAFLRARIRKMKKLADQHRSRRTLCYR
jgi:hypothetical protein